MRFRRLALLTLLLVIVNVLVTATPASATTKTRQLAATRAVMARAVSAADGVVAQQIDSGPLKIEVLADGSMGLWRYTNGSWVSQVYGTYSKGTRFAFGVVPESWGTPSGTFEMSNENSLYVIENSKPDVNSIRTVFTIPGQSVRIMQLVHYQAGSDYYNLQWTVTNYGTSSLWAPVLTHGEDTYFNNDDYGEGHWDADRGNVAVTNIAGGNVTGKPGSRGHMALRSPSASGHMEEFYDTVQQNAQNDVFTNDIRMDYHDVAYALRWEQSMLSPGQSWLIEAVEEVLPDKSPYTTPVILVPGINQETSYDDPSSGLPGPWYDELKQHGFIVAMAPAGNGTEPWQLDNDGGLKNNGWRLEQFLNSSGSPLLADYNGKRFEKVNVIGYSMGGLVTRDYSLRSQFSAGTTHLNRVVTLGTPHFGAPITWLKRALEHLPYTFDQAAIAEMKTPMATFNAEHIAALTECASPPLLIGATPDDGVVSVSSSLVLPRPTALASWRGYYRLPILGARHNGDAILKPITLAPWWPIGGHDWRTLGGATAEDVVIPYLEYGAKPGEATHVQ